MKTVTYILCDWCDEPIAKPEDGFIIIGNIYVGQATPDGQPDGGIIGDAFKKASQDGVIAVKDVEKYVYCKTCLRKTLKMESSVDSIFEGVLKRS